MDKYTKYVDYQHYKIKQSKESSGQFQIIILLY